MGDKVGRQPGSTAEVERTVVVERRGHRGDDVSESWQRHGRPPRPVRVVILKRWESLLVPRPTPTL